MSAFKVGQRVRIVGTSLPPVRPEFVGCEGVVIEIFTRPTALWRLECEVLIDGKRHSLDNKGWWFHFAALAPLTDPKADAFIERIKKLKPYSEPRALTPDEMAKVMGGA